MQLPQMNITANMEYSILLYRLSTDNLRHSYYLCRLIDPFLSKALILNTHLLKLWLLPIVVRRKISDHQQPPATNAERL